ncbi:MAG: 23S rRNA (adenine(2503)-C(2))-methyltransferase RlmN [Rhodospirillales bacterium]|jgi:23S rRNA (adenine2503-C2)-methyltransferase|nr:23S rRNA (adenine(2503)-C(2))-methyltransferase RlmN [Rhodospirillales bacterium]
MTPTDAALAVADRVDAVRPWLIGCSRAELTSLLAGLGEPAFRARQLWHWLYARGARDFASMTTLAKSLRTSLSERARVGRPQVTSEQISADGTRKWLLAFDDGKEAETVFIPEADRGTLCISSQVGCTLTCRFCHTGTQRLVRNLSAGEIVGQLLLARDALHDWPSRPDGRLITNVVLMGMGEPLFNYDNVAAALRIVMDAEGIAISRRRITLSTSGVVPMIARVGAELGVKLAISLHAATDAVRDALVPINRKYPLATLMAACRGYPGLDNGNRITFEYVMLAGVNDSADDARSLLRLVAGIPCKFNLIPFNPWPGAPYACSSPSAIERFAQILSDGGYTAPVRQPRGQDIMAACGQLRSASERERLSRLKARLATGLVDDDHAPLPRTDHA